jgi:hypothetical protein
VNIGKVAIKYSKYEPRVEDESSDEEYINLRLVKDYIYIILHTVFPLRYKMMPLAFF